LKTEYPVVAPEWVRFFVQRIGDAKLQNKANPLGHHPVPTPTGFVSSPRTVGGAGDQNYKTNPISTAPDETGFVRSPELEAQQHIKTTKQTQFLPRAEVELASFVFSAPRRLTRVHVRSVEQPVQ
jgi:hypothetical protein